MVGVWLFAVHKGICAVRCGDAQATQLQHALCALSCSSTQGKQAKPQAAGSKRPSEAASAKEQQPSKKAATE